MRIHHVLARHREETAVQEVELVLAGARCGMVFRPLICDLRVGSFTSPFLTCISLMRSTRRASSSGSAAQRMIPCSSVGPGPIREQDLVAQDLVAQSFQVEAEGFLQVVLRAFEMLQLRGTS